MKKCQHKITPKIRQFCVCVDSLLFLRFLQTSLFCSVVWRREIQWTLHKSHQTNTYIVHRDIGCSLLDVYERTHDMKEQNICVIIGVAWAESNYCSPLEFVSSDNYQMKLFFQLMLRHARTHVVHTLIEIFLRKFPPHIHTKCHWILLLSSVFV